MNPTHGPNEPPRPDESAPEPAAANPIQALDPPAREALLDRLQELQRVAAGRAERAPLQLGLGGVLAAQAQKRVRVGAGDGGDRDGRKEGVGNGVHGGRPSSWVAQTARPVLRTL